MKGLGTISYTPVFKGAAIKSTKVKLYGNNVPDVIIAHVTSVDTQQMQSLPSW